MCETGDRKWNISHSLDVTIISSQLLGLLELYNTLMILILLAKVRFRRTLKFRVWGFVS